MIARIWRGTTLADKADEYLGILRATGLADYQSTPGFLDVTLLVRAAGEKTHFTVISYWDSLDAIRAFAGDDIEISHYYPEDDGFLIDREETVEHHDVVELA